MNRKLRLLRRIVREVGRRNERARKRNAARRRYSSRCRVTSPELYVARIAAVVTQALPPGVTLTWRLEPCRDYATFELRALMFPEHRGEVLRYIDAVRINDFGDTVHARSFSVQNRVFGSSFMLSKWELTECHELPIHALLSAAEALARVVTRERQTAIAAARKAALHDRI